MVTSVIEQLPFLEMLASKRVTHIQKKALLEYATKGQVQVIREFFKNIRSKNIIPTNKHLQKLRRKKEIIIHLIETKDKLSTIRDILVEYTSLVVSMVTHILPYLKIQRKFRQAVINTNTING